MHLFGVACVCSPSPPAFFSLSTFSPLFFLFFTGSNFHTIKHVPRGLVYKLEEKGRCSKKVKARKTKRVRGKDCVGTIMWEGGGVGELNSCKRLHLCRNIWPATIRVAACFTPHIDTSRWGPRDGCIAGTGANLCSCRGACCKSREAQLYKHFLCSPKWETGD